MNSTPWTWEAFHCATVFPTWEAVTLCGLFDAFTCASAVSASACAAFAAANAASAVAPTAASISAVRSDTSDADKLSVVTIPFFSAPSERWISARAAWVSSTAFSMLASSTSICVPGSGPDGLSVA